MIDRTYSGEEVHIDVNKRIVWIHIKEPYRTAGKKYNYTPWESVGINKDTVKMALENGFTICLVIEDDMNTYAIRPGEIFEFCNKHNSYFKVVKRDITLCIVGLHKFKKYLLPTSEQLTLNTLETINK